jgi:hypothetical protein
VADLFTKVGGPKHPVRLAATVAEMVQTFANRTPADDSWGLKQMHPARWVPGDGQGKLMDDLEPVLRGKIFGAMLSSVMDLFERSDPSEWRRAADTNDGAVEPADFVPTGEFSGSFTAAHHRGEYANTWYGMIPRFREAGVGESVLARLIDFGAALWPAGDWNALR